MRWMITCVSGPWYIGLRGARRSSVAPSEGFRGAERRLFWSSVGRCRVGRTAPLLITAPLERQIERVAGVYDPLLRLLVSQAVGRRRPYPRNGIAGL